MTYTEIFDTVFAEESSGGDTDTEFFGESSTNRKHVASQINVNYIYIYDV